VAVVDTYIAGRVFGLDVDVALYNSGAVTHRTVEILDRSRPYARGSACPTSKYLNCYWGSCYVIAIASSPGRSFGALPRPVHYILPLL